MMQNQLHQIQSFFKKHNYLKKKTQKDPNPRSNHEIHKSKIGERERSLRSKNEKALRRKKEYLWTRLYKYTTQSHHTTYNLSKPTTQQ